MHMHIIQLCASIRDCRRNILVKFCKSQASEDELFTTCFPHGNPRRLLRASEHLLRCSKPGPIPAPNAYARKSSSRLVACADKSEGKLGIYSEEELILLPHFSNIFTGHHYTSRALFAPHRHNRARHHSTSPFHGADPPRVSRPPNRF
jgi:hypothetical protein